MKYILLFLFLIKFISSVEPEDKNSVIKFFKPEKNSDLNDAMNSYSSLSLLFFNGYNDQKNNQMKELPPMMNTENEIYNGKTQKFKRHVKQNKLMKMPETYLFQKRSKTCTADEFRCPSSGKCIKTNDLCDGFADCITTSIDENESFCFFYLPLKRQIEELKSMKNSPKIYYENLN